MMITAQLEELKYDKKQRFEKNRKKSTTPNEESFFDQKS